MRTNLLIFFGLLLSISGFATNVSVNIHNASAQAINSANCSDYAEAYDAAGTSAAHHGSQTVTTTGFPVSVGAVGVMSTAGYLYGASYHDFAVTVVVHYADGSTASGTTPWTLLGVTPDITFGTGGVFLYTNYTVVVQNSSVSQAMAYTITYNGSVVKQGVLPVWSNPLSQPSDSWTTPALKYSPAPADNFTLTVDSHYVIPQIGTDSGGGILFSNLSGGSSSLGGSASGPTSSGGTFSGGTNSLGLSGAGTTPNTNAIIWSAPSGSASESTLQAGFSTLHSDNQNLLAGESVINTTLGTGQLVITNQLGQVVTLLTAMSNETLQVIGAITNMSAKINTNPPSLSLTNYALETTQIGISNLLSDTNEFGAQDFTNAQYAIGASDTNADAAMAQAATEMSAVNSSLSAASNAVAGVLMQTVPDGDEPDMTVNMSALLGNHVTVTFDMNPVHRWPWVFVFLHAAFTWTIIFVFVTGVVDTIYKAVQAYASGQTTNVPNVSGGTRI